MSRLWHCWLFNTALPPHTGQASTRNMSDITRATNSSRRGGRQATHQSPALFHPRINYFSNASEPSERANWTPKHSAFSSKLSLALSMVPPRPHNPQATRNSRWHFNIQYQLIPSQAALPPGGSFGKTLNGLGLSEIQYTSAHGHQHKEGVT